MTGQLENQISLFGQDSWYGKMFQEYFQAGIQKERTSRQLSKKLSKFANRAPLCMCVSQIKDGQSADVIMLKMEDGALLGEYTMRSFGEYPREEKESRLSQILEGSPHPKYFLSEKACLGILNRAKRRGKKLPEELEAALKAQAGV